MSEENVEAFKRIIDAANRGDVEAMLAELDPEFEYHAVLPLLGGELGREVQQGQAHVPPSGLSGAVVPSPASLALGGPGSPVVAREIACSRRWSS